MDPANARKWFDQLAVLLREYLLHGHLQDRIGVPLLFQFGVEREGTQDIAIDEWMAASPIYSVRTQELLGFRGDTVDVILKSSAFFLMFGSPMPAPKGRACVIVPRMYLAVKRASQI